MLMTIPPRYHDVTSGCMGAGTMLKLGGGGGAGTHLAISAQ